MIMMPLHAQQLLEALAQSISIFEQKFGEIRADQVGQLVPPRAKTRTPALGGDRARVVHIASPSTQAIQPSSWRCASMWCIRRAFHVPGTVARGEAVMACSS